MKRPNYFSAKDVDERWADQVNTVRLWRAVIDQVLQDLIYEGKAKDDKRSHLAAWEWLNDTSENNNFAFVCELADLDEARTRKEIYKLMEKFYGNQYRRKLKTSLKNIERAKRERIRKQKSKS